jgi:hypothetical protein
MLSSNRTLQLGTSGVPVLSVFTTQNVAIGTTTDAGYKLDVNGTVRFSSLTYGSGVLSYNAGGSFYFNIQSAGDFHYAFQSLARRWFVSQQSGTLIQNISYNGNAIDATALFEVQSTTKGFLQPRMTTVQKVAISTPATGLTVYDTTLNTNEYYDGAAWRSIASQAWVQSQGYITGYTEGDTLQIVSDRGRITTSLSSTGTTLVASATTGYTGVFFNYTLGDGTNYRAGTVTSVVSSGSTIEFTETSTNDIGNTSPVSLSVGVGGGFINLSATTTTTGWTIKVVPQGI